MARPWPLVWAVLGVVLGLGLLGLAMPLLLAIALLQTLLETVRFVANLDHDTRTAGEDDSTHQDVTLVMPGTCGYIFWQLGMVHYVCEQFDTSNTKLAGISSGGICAQFILKLEEAASGASSGAEAAARVRAHAQELFALLDRRIAPVLWWPLGFLGRMGLLLDDLGKYLVPKIVPEGRIRMGVRRLTGGMVPALVPDVVTNFASVEDFSSAVAATSCVWLVVRLEPVRWLRQKCSFCCDGCNPFSFFCFAEYFHHLRTGLAERTAPRHTFTGGLDMIYPIWNCGVMERTLPKRGAHIWLTPTVGGNLKLWNALRFSGWFAGEQYRLGYDHARGLDLQGYFSALSRRVALK